MFVRLGFAVAAHLDAEIMLVDEVLAVGDAAFQRKCMNKIRDLTVEEGRTIVFVSHNLAWVERLCDRAFLIDHGVVAAEGPVAQVTAGYLSVVDPARARRRDPDPGTRAADRNRHGAVPDASVCSMRKTRSRPARCCSTSRWWSRPRSR